MLTLLDSRFFSLDVFVVLFLYAPMVLLIAVIASCLFIILVLKSKYILIGYLILTIGGCILIIGAVFGPDRLSDYIYDRRERRQIIAHINDTIAPIIKNIYPNAQFSASVIPTDTALVRLGGYVYQNQPDFDNELAIWRELMQNHIVQNFRYRISIEYRFKNTRRSFASMPELEDGSSIYYQMNLIFQFFGDFFDIDPDVYSRAIRYCTEDLREIERSLVNDEPPLISRNTGLFIKRIELLQPSGFRVVATNNNNEENIYYFPRW
jgi:hypothetical protein